MALITINFSGPLRRPWPEISKQIVIKDNQSIDQTLSELGYSPIEKKMILASLNGEKTNQKIILKDGDSLDLILLVGGG
jgi:sulfur carrier protein ThiS